MNNVIATFPQDSIACSQDCETCGAWETCVPCNEWNETQPKRCGDNKWETRGAGEWCTFCFMCPDKNTCPDSTDHDLLGA